VLLPFLIRLSENPTYLLQSPTLGILKHGQAFLSRCSLIFELQPCSLPSDRLKIAYLKTLSGRALTWATVVWEQQTAVCHNLEAFVEEVRKVFDSQMYGREAARKL
jgi:hypothetical protein